MKIVATVRVAKEHADELVGGSINELTLDLVILGVDRLSAVFGATTIHKDEAEVSR